MIPGFAILKRVKTDWLISPTALILFGISSIMIVVFTLLWLGILKIQDATIWGNAMLAVLGVTGSVSIFFLWAGMFQYWVRMDGSRPATKRFWFAVLVVGVWYGAIIYFYVKYLWLDKRAVHAMAGKEME